MSETARRRGDPADLPRRPRVPGRGRLPRPARAGDPRRAPREGQRGLHDRDADRARDRGGARGRVVARPQRQLRASGDPRAEHPARCARRAPGRVGRRLARVAAAARQPADAGGGGRAASLRRARRRGALRGRGDPLPAALPDDARAAPARGPHLVDPARRGDGRRRLRPQLAALVVGVAPADGDRVRARRLGRPVAATAAARGRAVRVALPRPDRRARERGVRERARAARRPARERGRRRAALRAERRAGGARRGSGDARSASSTTRFARTSRRRSRTASATTRTPGRSVASSAR